MAVRPVEHVTSILPHLLLFLLLQSNLAVSLNLNITALSACNGRSTLECWQIKAPFSISNTPGTAGSAIAQLGSVSNVTFIALPAQYDGGIHNAPYNQYVVYTTGLAHITIPGDNSTGVLVSGGEFGMIFAADTAAVSKTGHRTTYPGVVETIALQIPTKDGKIPQHTVLHSGPCNVGETVGLRGLAAGSGNSTMTVDL